MGDIIRRNYPVPLPLVNEVWQAFLLSHLHLSGGCKQFPETGRCRLDVTLWSFFCFHLQLTEISFWRVINLEHSEPVDAAALFIITIHCTTLYWRKSQATYGICLEFIQYHPWWPLLGQWLQAREEYREKLGRKLCKLGRSKGVYLSHAIVIFDSFWFSEEQSIHCKFAV